MDLHRTQVGMQTGTHTSNCITNTSNSHPETGGEERTDSGKWYLDLVFGMLKGVSDISLLLKMATPSVSCFFLKALSVQVDIWVQDLTVTKRKGDI